MANKKEKPIEIDLGGIDEEIETFSEEEKISELEKIHLDNSKVKQIQTSTPTYKPKNWYEQISLTANNLWVNINNVWNSFINSNGEAVYTGTGAGFKDEDDMTSDSAVATASQQSIKAYADTKSTKLYTSLTNQTISNSQAVTTLYSFTVPGGTFGTANGIHIYIPISSFRFDANSNNSFGLRFYYDDTVVMTILVDTGAGNIMNVVTTGYAEAWIYAGGATNSQVGRAIFSTSSNIASATKDYSGAHQIGSGTSAEDSTGDLTFYIKGNFTTAITNVTNAITCAGCFVTKIA